MKHDYVTNTPEDAAVFERMYGEEPYDDRPTLAEVADDGWKSPTRFGLCPERLYSEDGQRYKVCGLPAHGPDVQHVAHPQVYDVTEWDKEAPF